MYIDANTVITTAAIVTAQAVIGTQETSKLKLVQRDRRHNT